MGKSVDREALERMFSKLWAEECEALKYLESVNFTDKEAIKELVIHQRKRAEVGRKLNIGLL